MLKKTLLLIVLCLGSATLLLAKPARPGVALSAQSLKPTAAEELAAKSIIQNLLQNHYRKVALSDSLSMEIFNRFIDNLDGGKNYFTASEVESLRKSYAGKLGGELVLGKADAGFALYNFFLQRAREKMRYMKAAADTLHPDFSVHETLALDRKHDLWPSDKKELLGQWKKELKYQWLNLQYSTEKQKSIRGDLAKRFTSRLNLLNRQKPDDAFHLYTYAVTTSFDPHTSYFSPDEYENFQITLSRSLEGIGARLQSEGENTVVNEVIAGGPVFKSHALKKGDIIIGVGQGKRGDMVDVTGWRINDVVKLIRGKKGTLVRLKLLPASQGGRGPAKIVEVLRDQINLEEQAAKKSIIELNGKKIGVITIPSFYLDFEAQRQHTSNYNSTTRDVARILDELRAEAVQGIVLDLRNNGGGSLEEAVTVTGLFIPYGPVVQVSSADGAKTVLKDEDSREQYSGPLAVLVNRYSASASEIVAAALQDYGRGVVIGERTFGKGTVQQLVRLSRPFSLTPKSSGLGEMTLTIAKFYRITGGSTQHKGVLPDILLPSLIDASTIGEDTYPSSLPWSTISKAFYQPGSDLSLQDIDHLRQKELERSSQSALYKSYQDDQQALELIRKKKAVSLQESEFKSETELIRQIQKRWSVEADTTKNLATDVQLNESLGVVSDLVTLKRQERVAGSKPLPLLQHQEQ